LLRLLLADDAFSAGAMRLQGHRNAPTAERASRYTQTCFPEASVAGIRLNAASCSYLSAAASSASVTSKAVPPTRLSCLPLKVTSDGDGDGPLARLWRTRTRARSQLPWASVYRSPPASGDEFRIRICAERVFFDSQNAREIGP
jgi:hypothetical protein